MAGADGWHLDGSEQVIGNQQFNNSRDRLLGLREGGRGGKTRPKGKAGITEAKAFKKSQTLRRAPSRLANRPPIHLQNHQPTSR